MDKTKIQKVNKALVATVFATSGIAVVVPPPQKASAATSPFIDIDQYNSHYDNILKLYKQGAIGGFPDKTFRPNQNVTRGQAAKMLATVLDLDLKNVDNPYFTDVPKINEYYKYIAALKNAGIMSGYSNGTFMPNEIITRGQLSKMLVLGFKFEVATSYNHDFKDVNSQTSNAAYIQTLVDLKITEGTTPVTFSPYNAVTRGQIASFIVRAQDKKENVSSYKITSIEDDIVYINAVPYTVSSNLANIFNEDNEEVLKGAVIEGTFTGGNLSYVSKLTLNASGTYTNFLELNGANSSFGASIVVNGNYIRFADVKLTGTVFINETVRPPLHMNVSAGNSPRSLGRIASTNLGFINWSNPDQPADQPSKEDSSNGLQNWTNENKNPGSKEEPKKDDPFVNWSKDRVVMKNVEKYVEFYNSSTPHLVVSQNATRIETDTTLPRVDIRGYVREFEIIGNITTLNLNTETDLTIYGESNIYRINKYSYTDLQLYFDGRVGTLFVDNAYGWIDIGDYTYIDRVILPKDEGPNNIFDDFLDDKDNIGGITDPDGKPIDPDDIENQKPADKTKPLVSITNLELLSGSDISFDFTSTEVGTYYYIIREKNADPPTKSEMVNRVSSDNVASGTGSAVVGKNTVKVSNLGEKTEYVLYVMVVDGAKNVSDLANKSFQMKDGSPPSVKSLTVLPLHGGKRAEMKFVASEPGEYYYYVRPKTSAPEPTTKDIIANPTGKGEAKSGELAITEILKDLTPEITYQVYVVMKDKSGNLSIDPPISKEFTTTAPDNIHPYVENKILEPKGINQFYVYFNEKLEKATAENVANYDLSGTGIINVTGQEVIKPEKAVYEEYGSGKSRVLLTVPSLTGFVDKDTLIVTVLPTVRDLADNEFENINTVEAGTVPNNYAEYRHGDKDIPVLDIKNVIKNAEQTKVEVEFEASKAGTYYYMVMPENTDLSALAIDERDFVDEFTTRPSGKFDKTAGGKIYLYKEGEKVANLGITKFDIVLSDLTLDPFTSYSVFMVLKDRSGNLSIIQSAQISNDSQPPLISEITIIPQPGDKTAKLTLNSEEKGTIYYSAIPKWVADPLVTGGKKLNPLIYDDSGNLKPIAGTTDTSTDSAARKAAFISAVSGEPSYGTGTLKAGSAENEFPISKLTPHEEYVLYIGVEDTFGNFTIQERVGTTNTYGNPMMKPFYADGTAPWIKNIVYRKDTGTSTEFTITFNEAIVLKEANGSGFKETIISNVTPLSDILDLTGSNVGINNFSIVSYTPGVKTTEESKLVIKVNDLSLANNSFTVTIKDTIIDSLKANNGEGHSIKNGKNKVGDYKYQNANPIIGGAALIGNVSQAISIHTSNKLEVELSTGTSAYGLRFYYVSQAQAYPAITAKEILTGIRADNTEFEIKGSEIISKTSSKPILKLWDDSLIGPNQPLDVFREGGYIYIVTLDDYGTVSNVTSHKITKSAVQP